MGRLDGGGQAVSGRCLLLPLAGAEDGIELLRGFLLHRGCHVAVGVERHFHAGMSEPLGSYLRIEVLTHHQCGTRVPGVVESERDGKTSSLQGRPQVALQDIVASERPTDFVSEYETVVLPHIGNPHALFRLPATVFR